MNCPYCIRVNQYLEELLKEDRYKAITIKYIDETKERELANTYDYYLVPSFFYQDIKLYEGIMNKEDVRIVLEKVIQN